MRKRRPFGFILISLLSLVGLIYLILNIAPQQSFEFSVLKFPSFIFFFICVFLFFSFLVAFIFKNLRKGIFFGFFVIGFLLLNFFKFNQPFFIFMLVALFFVLELFFSYHR